MTDEKTYDASDPKDVKDAVKTAKNRDARQREALRTIMSDPQSRFWVYCLLERCHPTQNPFSSNALHTAFNCGEQNIGLQLLAELHNCSVDLYLTMMKENSPDV